jgi:tyrosyl-tRNA synthetase
MTTPLLEGLDGVEKMSKSMGNYVGVSEPPDEMFGKLMSMSDGLMWRYYLLLTDLSAAAIEQLQRDVEAGRVHPKDAKVDLAARIVRDFHGDAAARSAADGFEARFARGELDANSLSDVDVAVAGAAISLPKLVASAGLAVSTSEAARKIAQGGVKVDREKVIDPKVRIDAARGSLILEVGRRAVRVVLVTRP